MNKIIPVESVENSIFIIRGQKVMIDADLASLYGVEVKVLNQAVRRNVKRFPADFMFQLTKEESERFRSRSQIVTLNSTSNLKSQIAISRRGENLRSQIATLKTDGNLRSQIVTSSYGGRRYLPFVFTEFGVAMLSSVLRSERAISVNIEIMRTFGRLRQILASHKDLADKLVELEKKYDKNFRVVFRAIDHLLKQPEEPPKGKMGFHP